ncbi:hypothetical protein BHE74_00045256 [Ensete ventricosum]|nr:hypothetical protein GW17_00017686 [Ensete ventricosum]RWW48650.1 hypothetical protein BHE74_00045256 [Ensete ventricosum]RZS00100.1 hypothetical protein BHM03_00029746 [Ensete ventricosum]
MDGPLKVDVADTRSLKLDAWRQLASEEGMLAADIRNMLFSVIVPYSQTGKEISSDRHINKLILHTAADHVLRKVKIYAWIIVLCCEEDESELERLKSRLSQLYYENLIKAIVTEEDGMESIAHRFLSAAVKVFAKLKT